MIEQVSNTIRFHGFLIASGLGATGLTVTVDVRRNGTLVVTGGSASEEGGGLYFYDLTSGDVTLEGYYTAVFKTAGTADQKHVPSLIWIQKAGVENLDAAVSSRNATTPPTVGAISDQVWDEVLSGHLVAGSAGVALAAAGGAADPLMNPVPGSYAAGTAGFALGRVGSARVEVNSPVSEAGVVELVRADDYSSADGRLLEFSNTAWPDLTSATDIRMSVRRRPEAFDDEGEDALWFSILDEVGLRVVGGGTQQVFFGPTTTDTETLEPGRAAGKYDVQATIGGRIVTLAVGRVDVVEDQTR